MATTGMKRFAVFALLAAVVLAIAPAGAETGLVQICDLGERATNNCPGATRWGRPTQSSAVASCLEADTRACTWAGARFRRWASIPDTGLIHVCPADIDAGPTDDISCPVPRPWLLKSTVFAGTTPIVEGSGTFALTWVRPTMWEPEQPDSPPIVLLPEEIEGYTLFWGPQSKAGRCPDSPAGPTDSSCYPNRLDVAGTGTRANVVVPLTSTTDMFFAIVARTTDGSISAYSNELRRRFEVVVEDLRSRPEPPTAITLEATFSCTTPDPGLTCTIRIN